MVTHSLVNVCIGLNLLPIGIAQANESVVNEWVVGSLIFFVNCLLPKMNTLREILVILREKKEKENRLSY